MRTSSEWTARPIAITSVVHGEEESASVGHAGSGAVTVAATVRPRAPTAAISPHWLGNWLGNWKTTAATCTEGNSS